MNPSSGVFVKDAGNYETYLDGFQFPDNYRIFMSCGQAPLDITIGTDGKTDIVNLQFPENNNLDYTVYMTDTDAYSDMYFSGTAIKSKHAVIENKYDMYDVSDYMDRLNITKAAFKYVEYNGEETIDGIVCDSLACKMFNNNTESDCTFYFTKDGEYVKTTLFCPESNDTGYIEPVSEITIPDLTTEETGAKSIAAECLDLIRNGFTITPQTQETTEPPTEGENPIYSMKGSEIHYYSETVETPSGTETIGRIVPEGITVTKSPAPEDTPEGEVLTDYLVFQDYNNTKGTFVGMYWATHIEYISDTEVIYTEYNLMKQILKKTMFTLLTVSMLASAMTGCGKKETEAETTPETTVATEAATEAKTEITTEAETTAETEVQVETEEATTEETALSAEAEPETEAETANPDEPDYNTMFYDLIRTVQTSFQNSDATAYNDATTERSGT